MVPVTVLMRLSLASVKFPALFIALKVLMVKVAFNTWSDDKIVCVYTVETRFPDNFCSKIVFPTLSFHLIYFQVPISLINSSR